MSSDQRSRNRPPERLADRYLVQEEIGAGATAITYRGRDERLERAVAIKILREHYAQDEMFVRRFEREARAAASISHGNVVDVYDVGREGDALYIVMQIIEGEDLKHLIEREAPLRRERVASIVGQVLDGLQAIHAAGIVHRDIKPQNILIGRDGITRVTDFGIAQAEDDAGMTTEGTTVGTAAYMAPEQAQAGRITEATDLYAVGVILYEMLTGFLPFNSPTTVALMLEHIQMTPAPPSRRLPGHGITSAIDAVILRALAKNPSNRFQSAQAMKQAVSQALWGGTGDATQSTVAIPMRSATRQGIHQPVPPHQPSRRMEAPPVASRSAAREGRGLGGVVAGFALLVLLAMAGGAAWYAWDAWRGSQGVDDPAPTETIPAVVVPTATSAPTATDAPTETMIMIEQLEPTATMASTATLEPTATEAPTETPEPEPTKTPFPTIEPVPTLEPFPTFPDIPTIPDIPTLPPLIIEPIGDASHTNSTALQSGSGKSEAHRQDANNRDKNSNKKDDKKKDKSGSVVAVRSVAHNFGGR